MKVAFPVSGQERIEQAFQAASTSTGASFDYLVKTAIRESNLDPEAKARTSTAAGTFQFIESTWLETVKQSGARHGLAKYADKIERTDGGHYVVRDAKARQEILDLRHDPEISALMAGALTQKNARALESFLGRPPSDGELYIAHFLGAGGAKRLIGLAQSRPDASAADHFRTQAQANKPIFYGPDGAPRSAEAVYHNLVNRHDGMELIGTALASVEPRPKPAPAHNAVTLAALPLAKPAHSDAARAVAPVDRITSSWNIAAAGDDPQGIAEALKAAASAVGGPQNRFDRTFSIASAATSELTLAFAAPGGLEAYRGVAPRRGDAGGPPPRAVAVAATTATDAPAQAAAGPLPDQPLAAAFRAQEPKTAFESLYRTDQLAPRHRLGETFAMAYAAQTSLFSTEGVSAIDGIFGEARARAAAASAAPLSASETLARQPGMPLDLSEYTRVRQEEKKRELLPPV